MSKKISQPSEITYKKTAKNSAGKPILYIRKQFFIFPGTKVRILDGSMRLLAKAYGLPFRLREKIDIYSDEGMKYKVMTSSTSKIIDWNVSFAITQASGKKLGSLRRKGWSSEFVRDSWVLFDSSGKEVGKLLEDSRKLGITRRFLLGIIPQTYHLKTAGGKELKLKQTWNPFFLRYIGYSSDYDGLTKELGEQFVLGILSTITVIESRQR